MDEKNFNLPTPPADLPIANPASPALPARPPVDLLAEPEDILESIEGEIESTSANRPTSVSATNFPPARTRPDTQLQAAPPLSASVSSSIAKEPILGKGRRALVLGVVVLVVLAVLGVSAWYGYTVFWSSPQAVLAPALNNQAGDTSIPGAANNNIPAQGAVVPPINPDPVQAKPTDTDRDGLSDTDEELYGTNPAEVDTDNDGLTDRDEVKVFKTDPTNPDTDGDTFTDGGEVRAGYDPKGPGRLLQIEAPQ